MGVNIDQRCRLITNVSTIGISVKTPMMISAGLRNRAETPPCLPSLRLLAADRGRLVAAPPPACCSVVTGSSCPLGVASLSRTERGVDLVVRRLHRLLRIGLTIQQRFDLTLECI